MIPVDGPDLQEELGDRVQGEGGQAIVVVVNADDVLVCVARFAVSVDWRGAECNTEDLRSRRQLGGSLPVRQLDGEQLGHPGTQAVAQYDELGEHSETSYTSKYSLVR